MSETKIQNDDSIRPGESEGLQRIVVHAVLDQGFLRLVKKDGRRGGFQHRADNYLWKPADQSDDSEVKP